METFAKSWREIGEVEKARRADAMPEVRRRENIVQLVDWLAGWLVNEFDSMSAGVGLEVFFLIMVGQRLAALGLVWGPWRRYVCITENIFSGPPPPPAMFYLKHTLRDPAQPSHTRE